MSTPTADTVATIREKLKTIPLCQGLDDTQVGVIASISEQRAIPKGERLFNEGETGDGLYVVLVGSLEILKKDKSGQSQAIANIGGGNVIGEMSLINNTPRSASVMATTDCQLLKIPSESFSYLLQRDNVTAFKVVHNLAQVMSRRLLLMDEKLVDLLDKGAPKRKEELADFHKILTKWQF
jgi:CRP/FNR family transcriptional regulator, cyclic AMP receptor protein